MYPRLAHFGSVTVPTYGVFAAVGLVLAVLFAEWCAGRAGVSREKVYSLCLGVAVATIVLSRIALIAQSPQAFRTYPLLLLSLPTLTKYGALLASVSALGLIFLWQMPLLRTLDALAPATMLLLTFLHLGNFFAGTDLGSGTSLRIGNLVPGDEGHHPVALYAATFAAAATIAATVVLVRQVTVGHSFGTALALAAAGRFFADEFRPGYLLPQAAIPGFLRIDQIVLIALTVAGLMLFLQRRPNDA